MPVEIVSFPPDLFADLVRGAIVFVGLMFAFVVGLKVMTR